MNARLWTSLMVIVVGLCIFASVTVIADTYTIGSYANFDLISTTVETWPENRTRTDIGLKESVICQVIYFTDCDYNVTLSQWEEDTLGSCSWELISGAPAGCSLAAVAEPNAIKMTAGCAGGAATVCATVLDSGNKYRDEEITQKTITFTIKPPEGIIALYLQQDALGQLGNNRMGARTIYGATITPMSVNFKNVWFREHLPGKTWTWPDGTNDGIAASDTWIDITNNSFYDIMTDGDDPEYPTGRLFNGQNFVDFNYETPWEEQYFNVTTQEFITFTPDLKCTTKYRAADFKCQHTYQNKPGNWDGPWE